MSRGLVNKSTGERIPSAPGYIVDKVGDLSALHTTAKDKAVSAINEVADAVSAIDDGTSIDSFGDVETALAGKQGTLTFDNAPTDGSNNPVKSDGIYDALAGKQDIFERISYADWQLLSPQQQAAKPYYIYDYPSTAITAANVSYDHTQSGLSATTAQGGIDELASEKQDKTDNSLQTTQKDIVPAINEIKSGLTNLSTAQVVGADGEISDRLSTATAIDNFFKSLYNKKGFYHFSYYDTNKESTFATAINSANGFCFVINNDNWLNHPLAFVFEGGMDAFIVMFEITDNSYSVLLITKLARSS